MEKKILHPLLNLIVLFGIGFFLSCSSSSSRGVLSDEVNSLSEKEKENLFSRIEENWPQRHLEIYLVKVIEDLQKLCFSLEKGEVYQGKERIEFFAQLSRAYYFLADAHQNDPAQKQKTWELGSQWGEKALKENEKYASMIQSSAPLEKSLAALGQKDKEAIYWTLANLGKWAMAAGVPATMKYKDRVRKMNARLHELDPRFFYGASHRYWGAYYALTPSFVGGDIDQSVMHFKKAMSIAPQYLGTHNLYAEMVLTKINDQAEFKRVLKKVMATKLDETSPVYPENMIEQKKSQKMLENLQDYF